MTETDPVKSAINRAYRFVAEQQRLLDAGDISEFQWYDIHNKFFSEAYLSTDNPRAQSGHSGDEPSWRYSRMMVLEAIDRSGRFIDIGCANGYFLESIARWASGLPFDIEFHGVDISASLVEAAKRRNPEWRERFYNANAMHWTPPFTFDIVRTMELDFVPRDRRRAFFEHLFNGLVSPTGRLIIGPFTELTGEPQVEQDVAGWGYSASGYCYKAHQRRPELVRRLYWFDKGCATKIGDGMRA